MATVLYITCNPKPVEQSFSLSVGQAFLEAYRAANPGDNIVELDLYNTDLPEIDTDVFGAWGKLAQGEAFDQLSDEEKRKAGRISELTEQFVGADKYVFVTPMWNLSFPPRLKTYIDSICIAGKTFKYTEQGPQGLMTGKAAVHIQSRGGNYSEGPAKEFEYGDRYLRAILNFIGIRDIQGVYVEGHAAEPNRAEEIKQAAIDEAKVVAQRFAGAKVNA
ncbi:MAG TPA: FMN-dependent NADH-azoreductase [Bacilli bacterium]|nr:FMN-dependent NADH-azoreductase [Bacilli bacterium]